MAYKEVNPRQNFPELETEVLEYWNAEKIFEKSVLGRPKEKTFSFFDGPPFATGTPHYGHLLAGTIKDVIPRYKTMQGYRVERVWGWDTHGLPIENIVEQELDFKSRLQIEEYGVDKFNEKCRTKVLAYADEWKKIVAKTGRWVDMDNAYLTMDFAYMESVWWVFKSLWNKQLIYRGHKVMPYCPRCSTGLSTFEVGMPGSYVDKEDTAATIKFESVDEPNTFFLAWTTTPWTLPGNLALTVNPKEDYVSFELLESTGKYIKGEKYILMDGDPLRRNFGVATPVEGAGLSGPYSLDEVGLVKMEWFKGSRLLGRKYKPVFDYYKGKGKAFEVIAGDFVTTEDGTGIVHTAPAFGEDDYRVAKEHGIDFFMPVNDLGEFEIDVPEYSGRSVVVADTNLEILKDLGDKVLKQEKITHSYPHCWRCHTPLIYKAIDSYFVAVSKLKNRMLTLNEEILWVPKSVGAGRFANMIESAPDWNISRNRFWGTPLPVWKCTKCNNLEVFGSREELTERSGEKIEDLHLHKLQNISFKCNCGGKLELSGEVLDCWFESGSMPYGQAHYPFDNKEKFGRDFPADFIAEGIDQTRGWFNSLLILSTALFDKSSYNNVVVNGTVLAEDGQKMSKSLRNYPDPMDIVHKYGADAMRFYMMNSPVVKGQEWSFSEKGVDDVVKNVVLRLWNSYSFFITYAKLDGFEAKGDLGSENVLDKWLLSVTNQLISDVTKALDKYELSLAAKHLTEYIDELSNWYIRRSRKRFWKSENDTDKLGAYETLYFALKTYVQLLAPFMPFITENIYRNLTDGESVHLSEWPKYDKLLVSKVIEQAMANTREVIERGLSERAVAGIKVRQPLAKIIVKSEMRLNKGDTTGIMDYSEGMSNIIKDELNVKNVEFKKADEFSVELDTKLTPELKAEGIARDFVRLVQDARKKAGFNVEDRIKLAYNTDEKDLISAIKVQSEYITKETLALEISDQKGEYEYTAEAKLDGREIWFGVKRA